MAVGALGELINVVSSDQHKDNGMLRDDAEDLIEAAREIITLDRPRQEWFGSEPVRAT